ncbi:MAG: DEAD/DEAH box helicase [Pseudobdellovibrionaceae bacterium]
MIHEVALVDVEKKIPENQDFKLQGVVFVPPENNYLTGYNVVELPPEAQPDLIVKKNSQQQAASSHSNIFMFLFSNGEFLTWGEVQKKGYIKKVPQLLNPEVRARKKNEDHYKKIFPWWKENAESHHWHHDYEVGCISYLDDLASLHRDSVQFYMGLPHTYIRDEFKLFEICANHIQTSLSASEEEIVFWHSPQTGYPAISFSVGAELNSLEVYYFYFGFWNVKEKTLSFRNLKHFHKITKLFQKSADYKIQASISSANISNTLFFSSHISFEEWMLKNAVDVFNHLYKFKGEFEKISSDQIHTIVDLDSRKGFFKVVREIQKDPLLYTTHESTQLRVAKALNLGAWNIYFDNSGASLASRRQYQRNNDLKLFRHQGAFAYFVLEITHYLKFGEVLDPAEKVTNSAELISYLSQKSCKIVFPDESEKYLEAIVSKNIWQYIETFVVELLEVDKKQRRWLLSLPQKFILLKVDAIDIYDILLADLMVLAQIKGRTIFSKNSDKLFQQLPSVLLLEAAHKPAQSTPNPVSSDLNGIQSFDLGFLKNHQSIWIDQLRKMGCEIYFNGESLTALKDNDLQFDLAFKNSESNKWFEMDPRVYFKGQLISLDDSYQIDQGYIIFYEGKPFLIDGKTLPKYDHVLRIWEKLFGQKKDRVVATDNTYLIPKSAKIELLSLILNGVKVTNNKELEKIAQHFENIVQRKKLDAEIDEDTTLMNYQKSGVQWLSDMHKLGLGSILADEMGLGKTVQAIKFINQINDHSKPHLIVVPATLIYNWKNEFEKFSNKTQTIFLAGKSDIENMLSHPGKIGIVSYGMLTEHQSKFTEINWGLIIFDEAHQLKNRNTQRYKVAFELRANYKLALSGTPFENNLSELSSVLSLVLQGQMEQWNDKAKEDIQYLKKIIKPFILRRTKNEVQLQLPEKIEETIVLPTNEKFKKLYRQTASVLNEQIVGLIDREGANKSQIHILAALTKLRQLCSDPRIIDEYMDESPKFEFLFEKIEEAKENGESILVFSQFLSTIDRIQAELKKRNYVPMRIDGSTAQKKRADIIQSFQQSDLPEVLLLTLKTGGVGLNLTKASVVFHIDPWWNPAVENQATDRAHRIGQKKTVQSYRLILKDTLEEKIQKMKLDKQALFERVFSVNDSAGDLNSSVEVKSLLTRQDFEFLML